MYVYMQGRTFSKLTDTSVLCVILFEVYDCLAEKCPSSCFNLVNLVFICLAFEVIMSNISAFNINSCAVVLMAFTNSYCLLVIYTQGDANYLRYRGMQEFDQAMQHLEEKYGVSST